MADRWVTSPKPKAELTEVPEGHELHDDGTEVHVFQTAFGVRFARVVERSGFVMWFKRISESTPAER